MTTALRELIDKWRAELTEMERRISCAYAGDAYAAAQRRLELCIGDLESALATEAKVDDGNCCGCDMPRADCVCNVT